MFKAIVSRPSLFSMVSPVTFAVAAIGFLPCVGAQQIQRSSLHRDSEAALPQTLTGATAEFRARIAESRSAIAVEVADFDRDGTVDLVTGYAVGNSGMLTFQRGNRAATSPTGADWDAYLRGKLPVPFMAAAAVIPVPVRPDLVKSVDMNGDGLIDLVVAQRGDSNAYLLLGNGKGGFLAPQTLALGGAVADLTMWRAVDASSYVVAGVTSATGYSINVVDHDGAMKSSFAVPAAPTSVTHGQYNGGWAEDLAVVAGGKVLLFDGPDAELGKASMETLPVTNATAVVSGSFIYDRRGYAQMAVLDANGSLHVLSRTGLDYSLPSRTEGLAKLRARSEALIAAQRTGQPVPAMTRTPSARGMVWSEAETLTHIAPAASAESAPVLLRGRLSGGGGDDLAVVAGGQYVTVAHSQTGNTLQRLTKPVVTVDSTSNRVTSVVLARLSPDSRLSTIAADGRTTPAIAVPTTFHNTYTVNSTVDGPAQATCGATCNLRTAVSLVNKDTGASLTVPDKIIINAGTYSFNTASYNPANDGNNDKAFYYPVDNSVDIVGAGCTNNAAGQPTSCSTIINGNNLDLIFFLDYSTWGPNSGPAGSVAPGNYDIFLSGLELENGTNNNNFYATDTGNQNNYGGAISWFPDTAGYLTINQCLFASNQAKYGPGGAIAVGSYDGGNNTLGLEVDNSSFTGNSTPGSGGAIYDIGADITVLLNNDLFDSNLAQTSITPGNGADLGQGGALEFPDGANSTAITPTYFQILNSTFTNNKATSSAGAAYINDGFTITGSTFSNNSIAGFGGALGLSPAATGSAITGSTFTSNTAGASGTAGAIYVSSQLSPSTTALTMQYSRIHGNTAGTNSGMEILASGGLGGIVTATNDWWGCNGAATGTSCDAGGASGTGASFNATPYTTLALTVPASPTGSGTFTATGSMAQNSSGTAYSGSQDNAYANLPATLIVTEHDGTAVSAAATTLSSTDTITDTVTPSTALTAPGAGIAKVTVDGYSVTANFTLNEADMAIGVSQTGNVNAGASATYTITASNVGNSVSSGTVTVVDTLPSGFTATAMSGSGWNCNVATATCTTSNTAAGGSSFNAITLTASVVGTDAGSYTNSVTVSGGSEIDTSNDTATDSTVVIGAPTISEGFSPSTVAPNVNSTVTFTLGNPSANTISLTGVAFTDTLPTGLIVSTPSGASTTCSGGTVTATAGSGSITLSGAPIAPGSTCTVSVNVKSPSINSYTNTTGTVSATNGPTGSTAAATLTVTVTPTKLVYTSTPPTPIPAGANAGTVTVALEDASGNVAINNSTTSVGLAVTGPNGYSQTYNSTTVNGVASFNLSSVAVNVAGTYTYTATANSLTQAQATEVVNAGTAVSLVVTGLGPFTAPGTAGTATVKAVDAYGNTSTLYTGTVHFTTSDATATLPANYSYVAGDAGVHTFSVTLNTAGTQTLTATDTTTSSITGSETGILVEDAIWVLNASSTVARLDDTGVQTNTGGTSSGTATLGKVAFDSAGNAWVADNAANTIQLYSAKGVSQSVTGAASANINAPVGLAIDGAGYVWIANGNGSVSVLSSPTTAVTTTSAYQAGTGAISGPTGIVIDGSGSVWIANTNNSVTQIIGGAAPVVTPTVTGTTNNTLGAKP